MFTFEQIVYSTYCGNMCRSLKEFELCTGSGTRGLPVAYEKPLGPSKWTQNQLLDCEWAMCRRWDKMYRVNLQCGLWHLKSLQAHFDGPGIPLLAKGSSPPIIEAFAELTSISACHVCTWWLPLKPPLHNAKGIIVTTTYFFLCNSFFLILPQSVGPQNYFFESRTCLHLNHLWHAFRKLLTSPRQVAT